MKKVISVRFKENGKSYYFDPAGADIKTGEYVIVETARGVECGEGVQGVREIADAAVPAWPTAWISAGCARTVRTKSAPTAPVRNALPATAWK